MVLEMVTRENFSQMLGRFTTAELENMLAKFPYFHQGHLLLAKKYQREGNPKFDEQLQLAALYSQDRAFLFDLFNKDELVPSQVGAISIEESVFEPEAEEEIEVEVTPEEIPAVVSIQTGEVLSPFTEEVTEAVQKPDELKERFAISQPHTFDEWLKAYSSADVIEQASENVDEAAQIEGKVIDKELEQLYVSNLPLQELMEEETHFSKGLDEFIAEQKIKHKPKEIKSTANENELAPELITETIAKLYEAQKKYSKAISAYEVLALKYPEKSDLFAARISELKKRL